MFSLSPHDLSLCHRWLRTHIHDRLLLTPLHPPYDTLPPPLSLIALIVPPLSSLFARDLGDVYLLIRGSPDILYLFVCRVSVTHIVLCLPQQRLSVDRECLL